MAKRPVTEIIITKDGRYTRVVVGGLIAGKGPLAGHWVAEQIRGPVIIKDLRKGEK